MPAEHVVKKICSSCGGTGKALSWSGAGTREIKDPPVEIDCPRCEDGYLILGVVIAPTIDDILDKVNDVLDKCNDIKEVVDEM